MGKDSQCGKRVRYISQFVKNQDYNEVMQTINQRLLIQEQKRYIDLDKKPKLLFYKKIFKLILDPSLRLHMSMHARAIRSFLCNLIAGTLPLREEVGRFLNERRSERWCRLCNYEAKIDDTIHFLAVCPRLNVVRQAILHGVAAMGHLLLHKQ